MKVMKSLNHAHQNIDMYKKDVSECDMWERNDL